MIDALLAAIVGLSLWSGWRRGFVHAALDLAALVAGLAAAFVAYRDAAALLERHVLAPGVWAAPLAFLGVYLLARLVLGVAAGAVLRAVPEPAHGHRANRALGLLPGAANGLLNAAIVAYLLLALPLSDRLTEQARSSRAAAVLVEPADWLEARLAPIFEPAVHRTLQMLTVRPESDERIELRFTVADPRVRPDLEAQMLELVNRARAEHGLRPLAPDPEIAAVARAHARDMFARGYFSHVSPDGKDPFERLRESRVRYRAAGENLALAPTLPMAHEGLMNSPGHRANILRPAFGRLGVGVLDGGRRGVMVTQVFRN